ncbi:hypothetical protein Celaphus_00003188, partial [Cervus elaphus hippelaphus]
HSTAGPALLRAVGGAEGAGPTSGGPDPLDQPPQLPRRGGAAPPEGPELFSAETSFRLFLKPAGLTSDAPVQGPEPRPLTRSKSRDQACPRTGGGMPMDTLRHIYGGEAALRQMWAPCQGGDGARGLWKMLQGGRVFLELGLIFPKLGVENSPNCSLPGGPNGRELKGSQDRHRPLTDQGHFNGSWVWSSREPQPHP